MSQYPNDTTDPLPVNEQSIPRQGDSDLGDDEYLPQDTAEVPAEDQAEDPEDSEDASDIDADADEPSVSAPDPSI